MIAEDRHIRLRHALRLEYLTVGWNLVEGVIGIAAALAARSVVLLGFGVDSFVESASGAILIWRLRAEATARDTCSMDELDRRARRLVSGSLFVLALYVVINAVHVLWSREEPRPSIVGIALTSLSLGVMWWLARAKRTAARSLGSKAMEVDAFQTTACWWLSLISLVGMGLNAAFGWWWADPVAALGMTWFLVKEGREAWRGEVCGCAPAPAGVAAHDAASSPGGAQV